MIIEIPNYVSIDFVNKVRELTNPFVNKDNKEKTYNRNGVTVNVSKEPGLSALNNETKIIFSALQRDVLAYKFNPQFASGDSGYEYHRYAPGQVCHYHVDGEFSGKPENGCMLRYATVILFLTTSDDGELVFPNQNIEIKPEAGKIVAFPPYGFFGHYSKPSKKEREILMTWIVYDGLTVFKSNGVQ